MKEGRVLHERADRDRRGDRKRRDERAVKSEGRAAAGEGRVAASAHLAHAASTRTRDRDKRKGGYWAERERAREGCAGCAQKGNAGMEERKRDLPWQQHLVAVNRVRGE